MTLSPQWDPKHANFPTDTIRELGVYVGTDEQINTAWNSRITLKMRSRFDLWRSRYLPSTYQWKNTVAKNSVLACVWYIVEHQTPSNLDALLTSWQQDAWTFHD